MNTFTKVLLILFLSFAASAEEKWHWRGPNAFDITLHVLSEGLIVADCLQTFDIKNHKTYLERNPLLGEHPGDGRIIALCTSSIIVTTALWYITPQEMRWLVDGGIIYFELPVVINNRSQWGLKFILPF